MEETRIKWAYADRDTVPSPRGHRHVQNDLTERLALLQSLPLFSSLDEETLHTLAEESRRRWFEMGAMICYQGDPGSTCHIIVQGKVRIFLIREDGHELSVRLLGRGDIFGEMAIFEDLPRSASVEALEETQTLEMHRDVLLGCLRRSPALALGLLQAMSARVRSSTTETEIMASLPVPERLLLQLQQLAELSGKPVPGGVRITVPMTQQELAALIGTSRESVNRALVRLRQQGKVQMDKGWIVLLEEKQPGQN